MRIEVYPLNNRVIEDYEKIQYFCNAVTDPELMNKLSTKYNDEACVKVYPTVK